MLGLPFPYTTKQLVELTRQLLVANEVRTDAYVRPLYFLVGEVLPVRMHDITPRLTIACHPIPGDYVNLQGVRCQVSTWRRQPDASTPIRAKVIGSYVGPALAKTEAVRAGCDEAILLTHDGFVAEATTSNILLRVGDTWHTPAGTDDILLGITRDQVITMIAAMTGEDVVERRIHRSELYAADEVLLCGTAATVAPVISVDGRDIGDGTPGRLTGDLRDTLRSIARRTDARHPEWSTAVYEERE
jgi:branched-chain amino acid aminotransferase